jgi:NhaP-type Na+/H+ or K+/H+ antiporter
VNLPTRIVGGLLGLFFIYAAVVQLNDVDAWQWLTLYALAAGLSLAVALGWRISGAMLGLGASALVWAGVILPALIEEQRASAQPFFDSELGRECCGLLIVTIAMGGLWYASKRRRAS